MAKKQKSFADKAAGSSDKDSVYVKYINSVRSEKTGYWRFNEQMVRTKKGESLDVALKRLKEAANLSDIDLSEFVSDQSKEEEIESNTEIVKEVKSDVIEQDTGQDKEKETASIKGDTEEVKEVKSDVVEQDTGQDKEKETDSSKIKEVVQS